MTQAPRKIELLAPARNVESGMDAINCGADAVYIGAARLGARSEATNSTADIKRLADYAHLFGARVYVALNTIVFEDELEEAHRLALEVIEAGADALIVQDLAYLTMNLPIALNASTQMDNRSKEKVEWLSRLGFKRIILARELTIDQIRDIHKNCSAELEVFVHGALCVSYSGQCYASEYCFGRSANRGECAQFCRLAFDLEDENGRILHSQKHLLSLKDMNRSKSLEELMDAGVTSFKIEGRLKDASYVKNITSYYRQTIDKILKRRPEYVRSSYGRSETSFQPQPQKTFNRGFTEYFLHGRTENVASIHTPKSIGEPVGKVKELKGKTVRVSGLASFHNGDGLCFFNEMGILQGFRVNRAENNLLYLTEPIKELRLNTPLFRNHDAAFEQQLSGSVAQRTLWADLNLRETNDGYILEIKDEAGRFCQVAFSLMKQIAQKPQRNRIITELSKLGGTGLKARNVTIDFSQEYFIPASFLSSWRREAVEKLFTQSIIKRQTPSRMEQTSQLESVSLDYNANVANSAARQFYLNHGATNVAPAFELKPTDNALLMTCRHCIRYTLGYCWKNSGNNLPSGSHQLFLRMQNGKRFPLKFDCANCEMKVYAED